MKLCFLVTAWLVHVSLFVLTNSSQDIETAMARMSERMLSTLTKSVLKPSSRKKREDSDVALDDDSGVYRVVRIEPVSKLCSPAVKTLFVDVSNTTYAICVAAATSELPAEIQIGYYEGNEWIKFDGWLVENAVDVVVFPFKHYLYVAAAEPGMNYGSQLMKIDLNTNYRTLDHEIHGSYVTSIAVWEMKNSGQLTLALANTNGYKDAADLSSEVFIYEWTGTYFDQYTSIATYDVKDIEPFYIYGTAYLAIANFRRGRDLRRVDSEIFRFDLDKQKWLSYQKIATNGAMDWEFFSLGTSIGQEFFLALANNGNGDPNAKSMIYKFVDDKFVPFQCLPTTRATSFAAFSRDNLFILAVANENDAVHIYQYDGWRFVKSGVQSTRGAMADGVVHLKFNEDKRNPEVVILSVSNPRHPFYESVFNISFHNENPLREWHRQSTAWCLNMLENLEKTDLDKELGFSDVIFTDQPSVTINGSVTFEKGFVASSLSTSKFVDISTHEVFDHNLINKLSSLQKRLDDIKHRLEGLSNTLKNVMKIDGHQTILSNLKFQDAVFSCKRHSCHFKNINTEFLNGERIADWTNRMIFTDKEQNINGTLMAKNINASNMNVFGLVDGVKSENLVTKSGTHSITGYKIFNNSITAEDVNVFGTVDGVVISPSNILLSTGYQEITGDKVFQNLNTTWLEADEVNKRNLREFYDNLVLKGKSYAISGTKTFKDVTVDQLTMNPHSTINGVDLVELWNKALWIDADQEVQASITFSDVVFDKNLDVGLGINGIQIPGSRVVDITESTTFDAPQTFQNSTGIGSLNILRSLNGISAFPASDGSLQLDIFLKTGDQVVTGSKLFHEINLDADSDVGGYVDGVDLSELQATVLRKNSTIVTNGTWSFEKLSIKGPLTVKGKISSVDLKDVYERALKLNDSDIPKIVFNVNIEVEDLESRNINDIDIRKDLVLKNETRKITGKKFFTELVLENSSLGRVNKVNMSFLNDVMLVIGNQHIESKTFNRDVVVNNLIVKNTINNVSVDDIVSLQGGEIYGIRNLTGSTFSFIDAENIEVTGRVNGIDLKEMIADTMTYYGAEEVTGMKNVQGTIHVMNDSNLQTNDLNGINLSDTWSDAVFVDVEQEIRSTVFFKDYVIFDNLSFTGTIDGVSDSDMKGWMLKNKYQVVKGNSSFEKGLKAKDLKLNTVNSLNLTEFESNLVKVNEATVITGPVIFEKSVSSAESVGVTGKIQGIKLSEEAVLKQDNLYVSGEKTFSRDVIIEGPLTVDGKINNISIEEICEKAFLKTDDINVTRLIIRGDVVIEEGNVEGSLAGVELSQLKDAAVRDDGSTIKFSGLKSFQNVTFAGPVTVKGKFGSIDVNTLAANYMSLSRDQKIESRMEFDDVEFEGSLSATNLDTAEAKINNISLREINNRILKTSQIQNVTASYTIDELYFENDVFVSGKINGIELPSGVMRHNRPNYIESPKIFRQPLVILGNLDIENEKTVQGVDVSEWFATAVLKEGKFTINGQKIFQELVLNDAKVEGKLDGLKISEESLLMVYGDQVITGRKVIAGDVVIDGSLTVNGKINTVDMNELVNKSVMRDRSSNITGLKYFKQPLTITSLVAPTVSGIDIANLKKKMDANFSISHVEDTLEEIEGVVSHIQEPFNSQALIFQYYEIFAEFDLPTVYDWLYVYVSDYSELLLLLDSSSSKHPCSSIRSLGFDKTSNSLIPTNQQELFTSNAVSVKSLTLDSTLLFVANKNSNLPCSGNSSLGKTTVDIYEWQLDSFYKLPSHPVSRVMDMAVFRDETKACMVVLEEAAKVYCSEDYNRWTTHEILKTKEGRKISILQSHRTVMAIAADDMSNYWQGQMYVDVYFWDSTRKEFGTPRRIESTFTQSVTLANYNIGTSEEAFLILAEGSVQRIQKIRIFRYDTFSGVFKDYQLLEESGIVEWILLKTGEILLFVVDSLKGLIKVYQHKGVSGFVKIDTIKSLGISKVYPFIRTDPEDWYNHYLAFSGRHTLAHSAEDDYVVKILKSKMKGRHPIF